MVRLGIAEHVVGRRIGSVHLSGLRVARRHVAGPEDLSARLSGRTVIAADRRGKYLWLVLDGEEALVCHLGMSGQLLIETANRPMRAHQHATFDFDDDGPQLRFVDQRTFGGLAVAELARDAHPGSSHRHGIPAPVAHIAPDPLESAFDVATFAERVRSRRSSIKRVLLDQTSVSGIGNIYADEALWRTRLHGQRPSSALSRPTLRTLAAHVQDVMRAALDAGGTSFDSLYVNVNGASGYFDRSLHSYGRGGEPCERCGTLIVREKFMNRSSYFCPRCQRKP